MNYIYIAKVWGEEISVMRYEIIKETQKQYKVKGDYDKVINKYTIDTVDSYGYAYSLSKDKAIELVKNNIKDNIKRYETYIEKCKQELLYPIKEEY